jgi:hypothetical protein
MDDFVVSNLHESKNEWCGRLVSIFTPLVIEGIRSIFNESWKLCNDNNEMSKYLMTFQNLLGRVPKWNSVIIEEERTRIIERSGCNYLEDLITCVHIIQLKVLTCIRVGNKQKKIDISVPKLDHFIHRVYIHVARKVYTNVYLFERKISDLQVQKNNRELEIIVQECIITAIRESIPTESIIRAYLDESVEEEEEVIIEPVVEDTKSDTKTDTKTDTKPGTTDAPINSPLNELPISPEIPAPATLSITNMDEEKVVTRLSFNDMDSVSDGSSVNAPKTVERLEQISQERAIQRKKEEEEEDDNSSERIKIHMDDDVALTDIFDLDTPISDNVMVSLDDVVDL